MAKCVSSVIQDPTTAPWIPRTTGEIAWYLALTVLQNIVTSRSWCVRYFQRALGILQSSFFRFFLNNQGRKLDYSKLWSKLRYTSALTNRKFVFINTLSDRIYFLCFIIHLRLEKFLTLSLSWPIRMIKKFTKLTLTLSNNFNQQGYFMDIP